MKSSRVPLTELSSQVHNRRKMESRPPTYGKRSRNIRNQVPIWSSSPIDEGKNAPRKENRITPSDKGQVAPSEEDHITQGGEALLTPTDDPKSVPGDEDEIAEGVKNLVIAVNDVDEIAALQNFDPSKTPTPSDPDPPMSSPITRRPSRHAKAKATATQPRIDIDIGPLLELASTKEPKSQVSTAGRVTAFFEYADTVTKRYDIKKHAEGSFGDVYKVFRSSSSKTGSMHRKGKLADAVLKIIPIGARTGTGSRKFSQVEDVVREVKMLKALDPLHGLTRFRSVHVVQGKYPPSFLKAFHDFKIEEGASENDAPEKVFHAKQLFAILEMDDAGYDLATLKFPNIFQVYDIFWTTVIVLTNAEQKLQFEPRDMHLSNICIRPLVRNGRIDIHEQEVKTWSKEKARYLGLTDIRVTLIDYNLSRAKLPGGVAFMDLKNKAFLRPPPGAYEETAQQRAYRQQMELIRAASGGGKKEDWSKFVPKTNVVWLAYLLETLLEDLEVGEIVRGSSNDCAKAQLGMRKKLDSVLMALKVSIVEDAGTINSAALLLSAAVTPAKGWLNEEDVQWHQGQLENSA